MFQFYKRNKEILDLLGMVAVVLVIIGFVTYPIFKEAFSGGSHEELPPRKTTTERYNEQTPTVKIEKITATTFTLAQFDEIQEGMTRVQVTAILKDSGHLFHGSFGGNQEVQLYLWKNVPDKNGHIMLRFEEGKLTRKEQQRLK